MQKPEWGVQDGNNVKGAGWSICFDNMIKLFYLFQRQRDYTKRGKEDQTFTFELDW